eukprot:TRINITY_DN112027_c0_g1_i1.p1 TRINITY_DN112027_c0_g1~~TRINITY_DN112027_c0_g1_i1.p1  ORF type:complete len:452 (+),score=65.64 TRINITY_DN112027_c0_g1_i1:143-1357(+)
MASLQCLALASLGGLSTTLGVNVVQYKNHLENSGRRKFSQFETSCCFALNVIFSGGSIVFFVLSTGYGPVSIAMPILSATTLLANMAVQISLGIEHYTKSMKVGTWVLVFSIMCLVDVGPRDQKFDDPLSLLMTIPGATSMLLQLILMGLGIIGIFWWKNESQSSLPKILAYAFTVATSTTLGASIGKLMQMQLEFNARLLCIAVYLSLGVVSFAAAAIAASETDGSTYLPVRSCVQLLLNALTGLCVWEDWKTINGWTAYTAVYILIVLAVYEVSAFDLAHFFGDCNLARDEHDTGGLAKKEFSRAARQLTMTWQDDVDVRKEEVDALRSLLSHGLKTHNVTEKDLLELTLMLAENHKDSDFTRSTVSSWMNDRIHFFKQYYELTSNGILPRSRKNLYRAPTI